MKLRFWPKRQSLRVMLLLCAVVLVLPYTISRLSAPSRCLSLRSSGESGENKTSTPVTRLRIACYNIAHGRGVAASNWHGGGVAERLRRLDRIATLLREIDADIVVLNEVDFESSWSHSTNQAQHLAKRAGYPYWIEQRNFDFRILLWTWRFGNAVLAKHPITDAQVIQLPGYSGWETFLAGKKRAVICDISLQRHPIRVIATHLSHRSESLRVNSALMIADIVRGSGLPTIVAGDMNSTPSGFPNSLSDANGDNAMDTFDKSELFRRSPVSGPSGNNSFTFHSENPRSVIDWILVPRDWSFFDYVVPPSKLSDHRIIYADIVPSSS